MFSHVGMLTLVPEATSANRDAIVEGLSDLVGVIDGLIRVRAHLDAGLTEGNASLIFILEFEDQGSWEAYRSHEAHVAVITTHIAPFIASKAFIQSSGPGVARERE